MVQLTVDIGGKPGINCRGFCSYCYFKHARDVPPFGCKYCLPFKKGCDYCSRGVKEAYADFLPLKEVADNFLADLQTVTGEISRITISGGGDPSCYPEFTDLIEILGSLDIPLHIGYTSGKGFDSPEIADFLITHNVTEISFTVFAADPRLRKTYMNDPTPEVSLEILQKLAGKIEVFAAIVILAGINDGEVLEHTVSWLEDAGVKGIILMRFANTRTQGLILDNEPIREHQPVQTVDAFKTMVKDISSRHPHLRISGTPLYDPAFNSPFAIRNHPDLLDKLPRVTGTVSLISGSVASPFISEILTACGGRPDLVVPVEKEIACLITIDDLKTLEVSKLHETVIIPGRAFIHDKEVEDVLGKTVIRGPDMLTADGETSMGMTEDAVLTLEFNGFLTLIQEINRYG